MQNIDKNAPYAVEYDLTNCDKEPVHLIRYVQSHALLIACSLPNMQVVFISNNCEKFTGKTVAESLHSPLNELLPADAVRQIKTGLKEDNLDALNPLRLLNYHAGSDYGLIVHVNENGLLVIEAEPLQTASQDMNFQMQFGNAVESIQKETRMSMLFDRAANEVKKITGFDRVMVYKFDEEGNGQVIAEAKRADLKPYLGLNYPSTDIPQQARVLFAKNQIRFTKDMQEECALVQPMRHPETNAYFDQTHCSARGSSPIHVEYLKNMGVHGSMTIAIMKEGKLWGLIACHHYSAIWLDYQVRLYVKFLGQIISGHLVINSALEYKNDLLKAQTIRKTLLEQMIENWDAAQGLAQRKVKFTDLIDCFGGAIYTKNETVTTGVTPSLAAIQTIAQTFESEHKNLVWYSHHLQKDVPNLPELPERTGGILLLVINEVPNPQYIMWFRPEVRQEVNWGGNPDKAVIKQEEGKRLSPRKSFEKWKQIIEKCSEKWNKEDVTIALSLRSDIKEFFLKKYRELQVTNSELMNAYEELDSFSYTVAHDLRAPLRSIKSFAQILVEDYQDKLDEDGKRSLEIIVNSAGKMDGYIDNILNIARLGSASFSPVETNVKAMIQEAYDNIFLAEKVNFPDRQIKFSLAEDMPRMQVDRHMMEQVIVNIIENSIKYTRKEPNSKIDVEYDCTDEYHILSFADNGIGFDEKYKSKVFDIFSRLTTDKTFSGTGVGMTIASKIISRHKGKIDCSSEQNKGTTFYIKLPIQTKSKKELSTT